MNNFECPRCGHCCQAEGEHMNRTTCPYGMVDTCCENYNDCSLKNAEIKRQNEKIEFLARTNMLYSDWEHRNNQVTSDLIRKGIEEAKINAELRAEIERLKQREWVGLTDEEVYECEQLAAIQYQRHKYSVHGQIITPADGLEWHFAGVIEAKLKEKNHG
jgi:hypothetical protein